MSDWVDGEDATHRGRHPRRFGSALPKRLVGFQDPSRAWAPDVVGILIGEFDEGWMQVAGHISSNTQWAAIDIDRRARRDFAGVPYEWLGEMTGADLLAMFPAAPEP